MGTLITLRPESKCMYFLLSKSSSSSSRTAKQRIRSTFNTARSLRVDTAAHKDEVAGKIAHNIARRINHFLRVRILTTERGRSQKMFTQGLSVTTIRRGTNSKPSQLNRHAEPNIPATWSASKGRIEKPSLGKAALGRIVGLRLTGSIHFNEPSPPRRSGSINNWRASSCTVRHCESSQPLVRSTTKLEANPNLVKTVGIIQWNCEGLQLSATRKLWTA